MNAAPPLVTIGETMGLLAAGAIGPLRHATCLNLGVGGAESNVAIGVSRLGGDSVWVGRVGDDPVGDLVVSRLAGEHVDTSHVIRDTGVPTSLMLKERRTPRVARVLYYRKAGPGSRLRPGDLPSDRIATAGALHVTGITPALSRGAEETVRTAVDIARSAGVSVSLDVNYRSALWTPEEARPVLVDLAKQADILFAGDDEATLLGAEGTPEQQATKLAGSDPRTVVIKLGARGAIAVADGETLQAPAHAVEAVDAVGAGDAFVAGYLADRMIGASHERALRTASSCGAFVVQMPGDWEGLPTRRELDQLNAGTGTVLR